MQTKCIDEILTSTKMYLSQYAQFYTHVTKNVFLICKGHFVQYDNA